MRTDSRAVGAFALVLALMATSMEAQSTVSGWGRLRFDSAWSEASDYVEVAAGGYHTVARRVDGSLVAWGYNISGECVVPATPVGLTYVEIAAGWGHTVARRSDGSVVAWGENSHGQCNVPVLAPGLFYGDRLWGFPCSGSLQ